jgi:hypothetical protein
MQSRGFAGLEEFINYTAEMPEFWAVFEREVLRLRWRKLCTRLLFLKVRHFAFALQKILAISILERDLA